MKIKSLIIGVSIITYSLFTTACGNDTNSVNNTDSSNTLATPPPANGREPNAARPTDTGTSTGVDTTNKVDTATHH